MTWWSQLSSGRLSLVRYDFGFHVLNLQNNLRVLSQFHSFNFFSPSISDTEILLTKACSGLKIRTLFLHSTWVPLSWLQSLHQWPHDITWFILFQRYSPLSVKTTDLVRTGGGKVDEEDHISVTHVEHPGSHQRLRFFNDKDFSPLLSSIHWNHLSRTRQLRWKTHVILLQDICHLMQTCFSTSRVGSKWPNFKFIIEIVTIMTYPFSYTTEQWWLMIHGPPVSSYPDIP